MAFSNARRHSEGRIVAESNDQPAVLRDDQLDALRRAGRQRRFPKGGTLFTEGDPSEFAVIIDQGEVKVTSEAENGRTVVLALRGVGDLIGEFGCIDAAPRSASATALTPVTASFIASSKFRQMLRKRTDIVLSLLTITVRRIRESDQGQLEFGAYHGIDRAIRTLLKFVERQVEPAAGEQGSIRLHTNQRDLAEAAGVSRETVVRTLRQLARSGAISRDKGLIVIRDLGLLRDIVSRVSRDQV